MDGDVRYARDRWQRRPGPGGDDDTIRREALATGFDAAIDEAGTAFMICDAVIDGRRSAYFA